MAYSGTTLSDSGPGAPIQVPSKSVFEGEGSFMKSDSFVEQRESYQGKFKIYLWKHETGGYSRMGKTSLQA